MLVSLFPLARAASIDAGSMAPAFDLPGAQGNIKLGDYRGKTVYLDFWASWCGPCKQSFPWMNDMQAKYGARGLQVIAVNLDAKAEDARTFLASVPAQFTIAYDPAGASAQQYRIKGMPSSVLIGPDGKVISVHAGFNPGARAELERQITTALGVTP
ncbi:redoxin family protein [Pseudoduganella sp. CY13W]|uniref:Redoxin family protein n=2 Tax=Duganella qianjiadongensis TaxID=2692176 RepID=A0ABW9VJW3_9BURK|nr:redoxin family protein [Duganella qianjiadongensis]